MKINTDKMFCWYQQTASAKWNMPDYSISVSYIGIPMHVARSIWKQMLLFFLGPDRLTDASENESDILPLWHQTDSDAPITKNGRLNRFWPNPKPHRDTPSSHYLSLKKYECIYKALVYILSIFPDKWKKLF